MTNLEQAIRLIDAGWKLSDTIKTEFAENDHESLNVLTQEYETLEDAVNAKGYIVSGLPSEKEMLEFLKDSGELDYICSCDTGWGIHLHSADEPFVKSDITEALVEACVKVLKLKKAK